MEHFNDILFQKSGPAYKQHTNKPLNQLILFSDVYSIDIFLCIFFRLTRTYIYMLPQHLQKRDRNNKLTRKQIIPFADTFFKSVRLLKIG